MTLELATYTLSSAQPSTIEIVNTLLMFALIFLVFYFLVIRPQQKKAKQHREMLHALRRGDRVVTAGGIIGLVSKVVSDQEIVLEISENILVRVVRDTIASTISKDEYNKVDNTKIPDLASPTGIHTHQSYHNATEKSRKGNSTLKAKKGESTRKS